MVKRWRARLIVSLLVSIVYHAAGAADFKPEPVLVGKKFVFESKVLKESRPYLVHLPPAYSTTNARFPVVILLDGEDHFTHTSGTVDFLAENMRIPNMIVVGIQNTDRSRDMTPPLPATAARTGSEGSPDGAKNFLSFIADELLPHLDATYRTQQYRVLIGHSFGGLFATYALVTRPDVFDAYLSISPSLWWDEQSLVKSTEEFLKTHRDLCADLFVTLGNEPGAMLGGYWKFAAALGEARPPNLRWQVHRWPDETHGSVPLRSTQEGLQALFDGYYIHDALAVYDRVGLPGIMKQYQGVSMRLGYDVPVPELTFARLILELRDAGRRDDIEQVSVKYLDLYPTSALTHIFFGRLHARNKDDTRAIDYYSKALKLFPGNAEARAALAKMNVDPGTIVPELTLAAKALRPYVGRYEFEDEEARVTLEGDKLYSASTAGRCELRASAKDQFFCVGSDIEFTFKRDRGGRVSGVLVQYPAVSYERKKVS